VGFVEGLQACEPRAPVIAEVIATFAADAIVRILAGAFHGKLGRVVSSGPRSTRLSVEAFGRTTLLTTATVDLAKASVDGI
jgi:hypothetical protein